MWLLELLAELLVEHLLGWILDALFCGLWRDRDDFAGAPLRKEVTP